MTQKLGGLLKTIVFMLGNVYSCVYILACFTPYIHPRNFKGFTFLALMFPYLLMGMVLWLFLVLFFYRKKWLLYFVLICVGYTNITTVFAFHTPTNFNTTKNENTIRVLSWNVKNFTDLVTLNDTPNSPRKGILNFISSANADIVCLQDYHELDGKLFFDIQQDIKKVGNYTYCYFTKDKVIPYFYGIGKYGVAIFSKYPIINSNKINYTAFNIKESLAFVDVVKANDTIRIYNTHLQSMSLKFDFLKDTVDIKYNDEYNFLKSNQSIIKRLERYDLVHANQAQFIKQILDTTTYPFIFCADLNSVPSSYVYHTLHNGLTDAFINKGSGLGATYLGIAPSVRIDVILMSKAFRPIQYYSQPLPYSDHQPIVTDVILK